MKLADRLSAFFLGMLALALLATSVAVYALAHMYLFRHLDERIETALDTLEAAVDVEPDGLEWEPLDRRITLGTDPGADQVRWVIRDARGNTVDHSENSAGGGFPPPGAPDVAPVGSHFDDSTFGDMPGWRLAGRRLRLAELVRAGRGHEEDDAPDDDVAYPELTLTVGLSPAPVRATLTRLAFALIGTSTTIWTLSVLLGRKLVRRALTPLSRMAASARGLNPADPGWSLPQPGTHDELDALAAAYNDLLARLHEAYQVQRRFAGEASHQLRTPLAGLLGQLDVALRRDRSADEYRRVLGVAREEAARLRQVTESLLMLARPVTDVAALELSPIAVNHWLPRQVERWAPNARATDVRVEPIAAGLFVRANPNLLAQSFDNLLENAMKYSNPGTPITVSAHRENGAVVISVEDRGVGLSADDLAHVFEPFYRAETSRCFGRPGVGLGLAVAQRIAATFHGILEAQSQSGQGSRFSIRLPESEDAICVLSPAPA